MPRIYVLVLDHFIKRLLLSHLIVYGMLNFYSTINPILYVFSHCHIIIVYTQRDYLLYRNVVDKWFSNFTFHYTVQSLELDVQQL